MSPPARPPTPPADPLAAPSPADEPGSSPSAPPGTLHDGAPSAGVTVVTGASGTVGGAARALIGGAHLVIGRHRPPGLREPDLFVRADLAHGRGIRSACRAMARLGAGGRPVRGLLLSAGVDDRTPADGLATASWEPCLRVNAIAPLRLTAEAARYPRNGPVLPVVVVSSDVVTTPQPGTVVYGASKAALENGMRHAATELPIAVLLLRLPDIGVLMGGRARARPAEPAPVLNVALRAARHHLDAPPPHAGVQVWEPPPSAAHPDAPDRAGGLPPCPN